jgi:hypothetical protein
MVTAVLLMKWKAEKTCFSKDGKSFVHIEFETSVECVQIRTSHYHVLQLHSFLSSPLCRLYVSYRECMLFIFSSLVLSPGPLIQITFNKYLINGWANKQMYGVCKPVFYVCSETESSRLKTFLSPFQVPNRKRNSV